MQIALRQRTGLKTMTGYGTNKDGIDIQVDLV
jgi:hypothetical protein